MNPLRFVAVLIFAFSCGLVLCAAENTPPGAIISQSPDFPSIYIGSPSIAKLPDGTLVASHDWFGPGTDKPKDGMPIFSSTDEGNTWTKIAAVPNQYFSNLFVHRNKLYLLGCLAPKGYWAIRRSGDGGKTWTEATDSQNGILLSDQRYHTAPCPVLFHKGRIWRAFELSRIPGRMNRDYEPMVGSVSENDDLLDAKNWTFTNSYPYQIGQWPGRGWIEGNPVATPEGGIVNFLRLEWEGADKAALIPVSEDGTQLLPYDPDVNMVDFPGGAVKFTIRYDEKSKRYWTLSSKQRDPTASRNFLVLASSANLKDWDVKTILLRHRDMAYHAWQYVDWIFDNDNILFVSRTGWDGSVRAHDANYMTFHRIENFRQKNRSDDAPWIGDLIEYRTVETPSLTLTGTKFTVQKLEEKVGVYAKSPYIIEQVPAFLKGYSFTQFRFGEARTALSVTAKEDTTIYLVTTLGRNNAIVGSQWQPLDTVSFSLEDSELLELPIFSRTLRKGEVFDVHQNMKTANILIFQNHKP